MSKFVVRSPVIHVPKVKEYVISARDLATLYQDKGVEIPFPISDYWYYHTDREGWSTILLDLIIKSSLYLEDKRDCDWYARKAYVECCERYELNTLLYTYGSHPLGYHGFNTFWTGDELMIFEPNDGFPGSAIIEWGYEGYRPLKVLL